jgi:predicted amidohydrolase YtcJ
MWVRARATRIVDVGGRLVTPGLIEAHAHFETPPLGRRVTLAQPAVSRTDRG